MIAPDFLRLRALATDGCAGRAKPFIAALLRRLMIPNRRFCVALWLCIASATGQVNALEELVVRGAADERTDKTAQAVFGFDKPLLQTPRSISSISAELIQQFDLRDVDDLLSVTPATFTQSFFGVAGSPDVRGTPGEVYFRGMRRLDNQGNYPVSLSAARRVDLVRGPASPIHGPAKPGGYLNLQPKTAYNEDTGMMTDTSGAAGLSLGRWGERIANLEVGGPASWGARDFGYYLYGELEDSGSYYEHTRTNQRLAQATFDARVNDATRVQFGLLWHDYESNEVPGWNRLSQRLIDDGVYVTGTARLPDGNGDGKASHQEYDTNGDGFSDYNLFLPGPLTPGKGPDAAALSDLTGDFSHLNLLEPGFATIEGHQTLVAPEDKLANTTTTFFLDVIFRADNGWELKNQFFYEGYDHTNEAGFGFSQFHDSWVVEDKLVASGQFSGDSLRASVQLSPSIRHTDFRHGDDYTNEFFDRRDLSKPHQAQATRVLATQVDADYTEYYTGAYTNLGLAALVDLSWDNGLGALLGLRYDFIDMHSRQPVEKLLFASSNNFCPPPGDCADRYAQDTVDGLSWTVSLNYALRAGLVPYLTWSRQSTVIAGQGAEITVGNILADGAFDQSRLLEAGLKARLFDNRLYFALAAYRQERTDAAAQSIVTNQSSETKGVEFEARWAASDRLTLTFGYSNIRVINLNTRETGYRFSFIGADDVPDVPAHLFYGGALTGNVSNGARRAGLPENVYSLSGTYRLGHGWGVNASATRVDAVASGYSGSVTLPAYTLVNLGLRRNTKRWLFSVSVKNLTDERYFRANFPNLFGSVTALPELPRHYQASAQYRF